MTDEIKRIFIIPSGMTFKSWCEVEYQKIKRMFEYHVTTRIKGYNLRFKVTLIDYATKRIGVSNDSSSFVIGAVKAFYDYKGWELSKEQKKNKAERFEIWRVFYTS